VALDTETTGLSPVDDRIIELAAVAFSADGVELATFEQLVNPGIPIPPLLTLIHGITDDMVAGKPSIDQVLPEFLRFIGDSILLAHNAPYDVSMLLVPLMRLTGGIAPMNLVLDTCALARAAFPGAPNYKLSTIAVMLGVPTGQAHRALSDVRACKGIFSKTLEHRGATALISDLVGMNGSELFLGLSETMLSAVPGGTERAALIGDAIRRGRPLWISYHGGTKGPGLRLVHPITLARQTEGLFLVAHCTLDRSVKSFRLEKIAVVYPASDS